MAVYILVYILLLSYFHGIISFALIMFDFQAVLFVLCLVWALKLKMLQLLVNFNLCIHFCCCINRIVLRYIVWDVHETNRIHTCGKIMYLLFFYFAFQRKSPVSKLFQAWVSIEKHQLSTIEFIFRLTSFCTFACLLKLCSLTLKNMHNWFE